MKRKPNYFIIQVPVVTEYEVLAKSEKEALKKLKGYLNKGDVCISGSANDGEARVRSSWYVNQRRLV